jgi:cold shock CspA family protein
MLNQRKQGVVVKFSPERGIGIIQVGGPDSLERYFLHTKFIRSGTARPKVGQPATFEVSPEPPRAEGYSPAAIRVDIIIDSPAVL